LPSDHATACLLPPCARATLRTTATTADLSLPWPLGMQRMDENTTDKLMSLC